MVENEHFELLGDVPIGETVDERGDQLDFNSHAEVLAQAAVNTPDPITIGVFGDWGTGKTSLMRLMHEKVNVSETAVPVWFNAWQYEREEHLIVPLTATIARALSEGKEKWDETLKKKAKALRDAIRSIAYGISIKGKVGIPLLSEAEVNLSPKDMIERYQDITRDSVLARSLYFDAFEELRKCKDVEGNLRIIVFVDDLDRCFPDRAVALLEGIKLVLNQPGFSFVLGVNEKIIQDFVKNKYAKDFKVNENHLVDYLDKIVQVKVNVPQREPGGLTKYIAGLLKKGRVFEGEIPKGAESLIAEAGRRNPRSIVRLINRIKVAVAVGNLEKKKYEPLALLLHLAMDEPKYRSFVSALDTPLGEKDGGGTIGQKIASNIKQTKTRPQEVLLSLNDLEPTIEGIAGTQLTGAAKILDENRHLLKLLCTDDGQRWLRDEEKCRTNAGEAVKTTQGEVSREESLTGDKDRNRIIRDLAQSMVKIPDGTFMMGGEREDEKPVHEVTVPEFRMQATPVTQEQWKAVMGTEPSHFEGSKRPVESVSWDDAKEFCEKLSALTGENYRLPSEAEWEYACRGGSHDSFYFGNDLKQLEDNAWYGVNSNGATRVVNQKKPNSFDLYDMHGNVWEWCEDTWHSNYNGAPSDGSRWVSDEASARVVRGGSWYDVDPFTLCASNRSRRVSTNGRYYVGFRCACSSH